MADNLGVRLVSMMVLCMSHASIVIGQPQRKHLTHMFNHARFSKKKRGNIIVNFDK